MTQNTRPWKHDLCDCCAGGVGVCLMGLCCTPCLLSNARNEFDSSNWCFNCLCMTAPAIRNVIREGYEIQGDCCGDILISHFCYPCSACQIANEVHDTGHVTGKV